MVAKNGLSDTLQSIETQTQGSAISMDDIVRALQKRGFGPLLVAPSLIIVLPTGAIPGVPAFCALFIFMIAIQLVFGAKHPWLPLRLRKFSFSKKQFTNAHRDFKKLITWIDGFFHPRLEFLTHQIAQRLIAVLCIILSVFIIMLGFIPFAPFLPGLAILILGLGVSMHDGLTTFIGLLVVAAAFFSIPYFIGMIAP